MREDDRVRLGHMLGAAADARAFLAGRTRGEFDSDTMLRFAVVRALEILGEAASRVSSECRQQAPLVHWQAVVGMRNRLIHGYFDVDHEFVWQTVHQDLPPLVSEIERLLV